MIMEIDEDKFIEEMERYTPKMEKSFTHWGLLELFDWHEEEYAFSDEGSHFFDPEEIFREWTEYHSIKKVNQEKNKKCVNKIIKVEQPLSPTWLVRVKD